MSKQVDDFNSKRSEVKLQPKFMTETYPERTVGALLSAGILSVLLGIGIIFSQSNPIVGISLIVIGAGLFFYGIRIWLKVRKTDERNYSVPKFES